MKFRIGTALAFGVGYLLGTRAGRERYLQIVRTAGQVGRSAPVASTASLVGTKSKAVATLGVERLKDAVGIHLRWRDQTADDISVDLPEDLAYALKSQRRQSELGD